MHRLILFTWLIFQVSVLSAQKYNTDYGLKLGVNYSSVLEIDQQLNYELTNQYRSRPGVNAGAFFIHDFNRFIGVDLELSADILGVYATSPVTRLSYYYASIPVAFRFNIPEDFFISAGLIPSYFVWGTVKDIEGRIESTVAKDYFYHLNGLDLRWSAGFGWKAKERLLWTLNFSQSIGAVSSSFPLKHQYAQIGLRYFLKEDIKRTISE